MCGTRERPRARKVIPPPYGMPPAQMESTGGRREKRSQKERREALTSAVLTPTILVAEGGYYIFYTAVQEPFDDNDREPKGTRTAVGIAYGETPDGPRTRLSNDPVLRPSENPDDFDSMGVDDTCLVARENGY